MGPEHPETLATQQQIADAMNSPGQHAAAEAEYCALLAVMERCGAGSASWAQSTPKRWRHATTLPWR